MNRQDVKEVGRDTNSSRGYCQVDEKLVDRPHDTGLKPVVNPPCWAPRTVVGLNLTIPFATLEWVDSFNLRRLQGPIGDVPLAEFEAQYCEQAEAA